MKLKDLGRLLVKIAVSFIFGAVHCAVWIVASIMIAHLEIIPLRAIGWLLGPVMTAAGFALGIFIYDILSASLRIRFFRVFLWPLIGCAIGAVAFYWIGPMFTGFGMLVAGTASVILREFILSLKRTKN